MSLSEFLMFPDDKKIINAVLKLDDAVEISKRALEQAKVIEDRRKSD